MRRITTIFLLTVVALVGGACSGDDGDTGQPPLTTKPEVAAGEEQAAILEDWNTRVWGPIVDRVELIDLNLEVVNAASLDRVSASAQRGHDELETDPTPAAVTAEAARAQATLLEMARAAAESSACVKEQEATGCVAPLGLLRQVFIDWARRTTEVNGRILGQPGAEERPVTLGDDADLRVAPIAGTVAIGTAGSVVDERRSLAYRVDAPWVERAEVQRVTVFEEGERCRFSITLTALGTQVLGDSSSNGIGRRIAVIVAGRAVSTPIVNQRLTSNSFVFTAGQSLEDCARIVADLA